MRNYDTKARIILGLVGLLFLSYLGYHITRLNTKKFETQTAEYDTVHDTIRAEGFVLRDELTVPLVSDGILVYNYDSGEKVGTHSILANIYSSEESAQNKQRAEQVSAELENLRKIQDMHSANHSNIELLSNQINEKVHQLTAINNSGIVVGLPALKEDLAFMFNKKQVALRKGDNFDKRIDYLENQLAYLQENTEKAQKSIKTPSEGYFTKYIDGFENIYTIDKLPDLSVEMFDEMMRIDASRQGEYVGKIVKNQNWYFIVSIPQKQMQQFYQNTHAILDFGFASGETVDAKIYRIIGEEEDERSLVVLQCKDINEDLLTLRRQSVDITFRTYSGLKVSREALSYEQSVIGVYVLERDAIVRFKPISIIRDQGSYVLCEGIGEDKNCLKRFDEVILNGGNLEDGQKIN